jgi:hypothetical protein
VYREMLVLVLPFEIDFLVADLLHLFLVSLLHLSPTLFHIGGFARFSCCPGLGC